MKHFIVLIFFLLSFKTYGQASPAVIYNAGYGKVIPEFGLRFKDNKTLISGTNNPSVTATDAPIGSIYISSNGLTYQKQDNGLTTNWTPLYFVPIFTDDNRLVRTDGTDNVQQSGVTLSDLDAMTGLTNLTVDLLNFDSYIISTTALNQALELKPNGTGTVDIPYLTNGAALFAGSNGAISQDFANYQYSALDGLKVDNLQLNGNSVSSTDTNGDINLTPSGTGDVVVSTLTDGRVVYNSSGALVDDAGFSFDGTTDVLKVGSLDIGGLNTITTSALNTDLILDANGTGKVDVNAPINLESVTANQVAFSDTATGNIVGDADFVYDAAANSLTASELNFSTSVISSTVTNQDITLSPNGLGEVIVSPPMNVDDGIRITDQGITGINAAADLRLVPASLRQIELAGDTEINNLFFPAAVGSGALVTTNLNQDITLSPDGTGELVVTTPSELQDVRIASNDISTKVLNGNINLLANGTGDATVTYGTNELSLDPSRSDDNLLRNGDFENQIVEYACTDATGAIVVSTIPMQNSAQMFQMTVTDAGGYCDFTATTGAKFEGLLFKIGGLFQTELTDVEYCTLVNGAEDNCIPISAVEDDATDPFTQPLRTQSQAGATSVGIRVKTTASTSGVVNLDKLKLVIGELNTGSAISCSGDLDCENTFAARVSSAGAIVTIDTQGWIGTCTVTDTSLYTCPLTGFTVTPVCEAQIFENADTSVSWETDVNASGTDSTQVQVRTGFSTAADTFTLSPRDFNIYCKKQGVDHKPITQQGVANVGALSGDSDWQEYTPTTGLTGGTASIDGRWRKIGDSMEVRISASWSSIFTGGTPTFTLPSGFEIDLEKFPNGTASTSFTLLGRAFLEDSGAGSTSSPYYADVLYSSSTGVIIKYAGNIASNAFPASLDPVSTTLPFNWANNDSIHMNFTVPIVGWSSSKTVQAKIIDKKIYDGNEYLAGEIAVVGGVEKVVYRRCYNIATDITTTTAFSPAPPAGLTPVGAINFQTTNWRIISDIVNPTTFSVVNYNDSTGVLQATFAGGTNKLGAGTKFCFKYTKP